MLVDGNNGESIVSDVEAVEGLRCSLCRFKKLAGIVADLWIPKASYSRGSISYSALAGSRKCGCLDLLLGSRHQWVKSIHSSLTRRQKNVRSQHSLYWE